MNGRYLLDTNIIIALFADEAIVKSNLAQTNEVFIPSFVIGALQHALTLVTRDAHFQEVENLQIVAW
jgi:predicted nucleic acid-binding protein